MTRNELESKNTIVTAADQAEQNEFLLTEANEQQRELGVVTVNLRL